MTKSKPDRLVIETAINEMTDQYSREVRLVGGKIFLEGHDITHLTRSYSINAMTSHSIEVSLELTGVYFSDE